MAAHELTWEEADRWIRDLGTDWNKVLKLADVRTHKDMLKARWKVGGESKGGNAPRDRAKVRKTLEDLERKKSTAFGSTMLALEEWMKLGARIARVPENFLVITEHLRKIAAAADKASNAQSTVEAARAAMEEAMAPLRSPLTTEPPDRTRSLTPGPRRPSV